MIRTSALMLIAALGALQQTGCCWHRPLFSRACHPYFGLGFGTSVAPAPVFPGVAAPSFVPPLGGPDCLGCGGGYSSAAPVRVGPYGLPPQASEPLAHAPAPMPAHFNNLPPSYAGVPPGFNPDLAGLPIYPTGKPLNSSAAPPTGSTPLPAPMPTKDDKK